jgi:hypothetical protein
VRCQQSQQQQRGRSESVHVHRLPHQSDRFTCHFGIQVTRILNDNDVPFQVNTQSFGAFLCHGVHCQAARETIQPLAIGFLRLAEIGILAIDIVSTEKQYDVFAGSGTQTLFVDSCIAKAIPVCDIANR